MSTADIVIRSVPVDRDGRPLDPSVRLAGAPALAATEPAPTAREASPERDRPFDPTEFARNLPKAETANLASLAEASIGSQSVKVVHATKPKVEYRGRNLKPVIYELDVPFTLDGTDYDAVTLSSPKGELYERFQEVVVTHGGETAVLWLVMSGMSPDAVAAIHQFDLPELNKLMLPFLPRLMRQSIEKALQEDEKTAASSTTQDERPE